jgi:hypothetical protein
MAWQLFERNSLRPHVPPFARSPSMEPKIETCNNTPDTCPIIFSHTLLYDHRRTITITRRDPICFLRRFLLGDRRRNTASLIPLARTLCCLFFCFCFSLLIWSLLPISFFFWISKCSHLLLSPCCPGFYTREEVDHGEYVDVAFAQYFSVGGRGLILLETKPATFDSPLLFQNGKVKWD